MRNWKSSAKKITVRPSDNRLSAGCSIILALKSSQCLIHNKEADSGCADRIHLRGGLQLEFTSVTSRTASPLEGKTERDAQPQQHVEEGQLLEHQWHLMLGRHHVDLIYWQRTWRVKRLLRGWRGGWKKIKAEVRTGHSFNQTPLLIKVIAANVFTLI